MLFSDVESITKFSSHAPGRRRAEEVGFAGTQVAPERLVAASATLSAPHPVHSGGAVPTVTAVLATPSLGIEYPGDTITITLDMSTAVTVTGVPTLALNDGGSATYSGGSGSNALTFTTVVTNSDRTVATLAITAVSEPSGAVIADASGHVANLAGAITTLTGLGVDPPTTGSYVDGSAGAPAGTPQLPTLLNGYAARPPWKVAGVDYPVGVPSGTSLKNPTTIAMPGVSVSGTSVNVTGSNVTLDGYDFSQYVVNIESGATNTVIKNSLFNQSGSFEFGIHAMPGSSNLTLLNNTFSGGGGITVYDDGSGTFVGEYNYFINTAGDGVDFGTGALTGHASYNVFDNLGMSGGHPDSLQFYNDPVTNFVISFNTIYQPNPSGMQGIQVSGGNVTNDTVENNVIVAKGPSPTIDMSYSISVGVSSGYTLDGAIVSNNYIDTTGAYGPFYPPNGSNLTYTDNVNLATGTDFSSPKGTATSDVTSVSASPSSGTEVVGDTITLTLHMDQAMTVTGTPTLSLNDGGTATYSGGSGTSTLTFTYTVGGGGQSVPALAVTGVNLPSGAGIKDSVGNPANLAGAVTTFSSLAVDPPCFCRGTHIATPDGEVPVERLRAGDVVTTLSGVPRRLRWVGFGRTLVTPRYRDHASVVVVRRDALADGVPHRDLYVTHGHSFYFDGVLIPAAHLVNHRSIAWVDDARVVEYYHLELDSHDVILAEGAAAESYRDDDNSQYFHNVADRPAARPLPSCAPVLHDHPTVKRIWRALHERAGRLDVALTEDPDLHLLADGERLDAERVGRRVWRFRLPRPVSDLRIVSRSAIPAMVGTEPDQRRLGVALRRIVLARRGARQAIGWDDARLTAGFHDPEPLDRHRWTDGEAALPLALLASLRAGATVELHVNGLLPYPVTEPSRHLPEGSPLRAGAEPSGAAVVVPASEVELARTERAERMRRRGYGIVHDPELRVLADDGEAIALHRFGERLCLAVPAGARRLRLASRQATPVDLDVATGDRRRLGVALAQLRLDGILVPLDDPRLLDGWHAPEPGFRWTNGAAVLDVTGIAVVELRLAAIPLPYVTPTPLDLPRQAAG